jgi:glucose-6-phosphate 1-dehydrogenase
MIEKIMEKPENCILIIFGASGDLTRRKLIPALYQLYSQTLLPEKFIVLGVSRTKLSDAAFRDTLLLQDHNNNERLEGFLKMLFYQSIDTKDPAAYQILAGRLRELDQAFQTGGNYIYYLSIAPSMYETIVQNLAAVRLNKANHNAWRRLIIEKPFGYDLASARRLNHALLGFFKEDQIFRIDHYLGKETVQNLLAFRFANGIFEPLWNRNYIDYVEVTAAEEIGVENRGKYYDTAGALRDMFQNHLLQIVSMTAMEPPATFDANTVRNEIHKIVESLHPIEGEQVEHQVIRGQYLSSTVRGETITAYRSEQDIDPESRTETYVAAKFFIDNWRWGGVPFYVRTGKRLPTRVSEIVINFKPTPHQLFGQMNNPNQLILRIQPDEGILLKFGMKLPGTGFKIKTVNMDFHYSDLSDQNIPEAYERLLLDCMLGDATLYARGDTIEACWSFVDPILNSWREKADSKIYGYPAGTWGPKESLILFKENKQDWRYPCKNLTNEDKYCEL